MTDYTIKSGDTLSAIASKYGVSVDELKAANSDIDNANSIKMGETIEIPMVEQSSVSAPIDSLTKATAKPGDSKINSENEDWQNLEEMLANGKDKDSTAAKITAEKGFLGIKTGTYNYTSDGSSTYGELKEQLGLEEGVFWTTENLTAEVNSGGYDADNVIPEGTVLEFSADDLPNKPLTNENGEEVEGFSKSLVSKTIYYTVQAGDTPDGIYEKFEENKSSLKGYATADAMKGYSENTLQIGTKVGLSKKFLGIF